MTEQKEPIILTEDLVVYKSCAVSPVSSDVYAKFQSYVYKKGKHNKTEFGFGTTRLHDSKNSPYDQMAAYSNERMKNPTKTIHEGFHFALNGKRLISYSIQKFIVPKGAEVYYDNSGLGVANEIIYDSNVSSKFQ